jgi:hypothetical protein
MSVCYAEISRSEFHHFTEQQLSRIGQKLNVEIIVQEIVDRSNLFRISGDSLEFKHFIIQEFFAGRGIPSKEHIATILASEWWQRPIVFYYGESSNNGAALNYLFGLLEKQTSNLVVSAVTCGLAGQACYLIDTEDKIPLFTEVIVALIRGREQLIKNISEGKIGPIMESVYYYLVGKDCVSFSQMNVKFDAVSKRLINKFTTNDLLLDNAETKKHEKLNLDLAEFWQIIGLLETGAFDLAEERIKKFSPADIRLYICLHLGCFFIEKIKPSSDEDQAHAKRIARRLLPSVEMQRVAFKKEFSSYLLELRKGKIIELKEESSRT